MMLRDDKYEKDHLDFLDSFIRLKNLGDRDPFPDEDWDLFLQDNGSQGLIDYLRECEEIDNEANIRGVRI